LVFFLGKFEFSLYTPSLPDKFWGTFFDQTHYIEKKKVWEKNHTSYWKKVLPVGNEKRSLPFFNFPIWSLQDCVGVIIITVYPLPRHGRFPSGLPVVSTSTGVSAQPPTKIRLRLPMRPMYSFLTAKFVRP
jgi:hypothetical protein